MVVTDTIEGVVNKTVWFHYDVKNDVLYVRFASSRESQAIGEETPEGFILLRDADSDEPIGITVVSWWKRFGEGPLPDSIAQLQNHIEPWAGKVNTAA